MNLSEYKEHKGEG